MGNTLKIIWMNLEWNSKLIFTPQRNMFLEKSLMSNSWLKAQPTAQLELDFLQGSARWDCLEWRQGEIPGLHSLFERKKTQMGKKYSSTSENLNYFESPAKGVEISITKLRFHFSGRKKFIGKINPVKYEEQCSSWKRRERNIKPS